MSLLASGDASKTVDSSYVAGKICNMKGWMHCLSLVLVSLAAGAVATVAVAWGCLLWAAPENPRPGVQFVRGGHRITDAMSEYGNFDGFAVFEYRGLGWEMDHTLANHPGVSRTSPEKKNEMTRVSAGWPWLCLDGERRMISAQVTTSHLATLPAITRSARREYVPFAPRWLAFVANTLAFATASLALALSIVVGKRAYRRLRGRCAVCGYELRGFLQVQDQVRCPECGKLAKRPTSH